jgi:hypothetical protein
MRLLKLVDFGDVLCRMSEMNLTPLQCRQVGNRRPLMTVTSCGIVGVHRIVRNRVDAGLRNNLARLVFLCHLRLLVR